VKKVRERLISSDFTYMRNLKTNKQTNKQMKKQQKYRLINTENKLVVARGEVGKGMGEIDKNDYKVHTLSYKINKSWR